MDGEGGRTTRRPLTHNYPKRVAGQNGAKRRMLWVLERDGGGEALNLPRSAARWWVRTSAAWDGMGGWEGQCWAGLGREGNNDAPRTGRVFVAEVDGGVMDWLQVEGMRDRRQRRIRMMCKDGKIWKQKYKSWKVTERPVSFTEMWLKCWLLEKERQPDRQMDRQTDRQRDRDKNRIAL